MRTCVRLLVRQNTAASQYGLRELGPLQAYVLLALILNLVLRTPCKLFGHAILRPPLRHGNSRCWLHVRPSVFSIARATRAILFASATIASIVGFLWSMLANQALGWILPHLTPDTTALAPMIRRRLNVRSPILDIRPNRCFPPVDRSSGGKPTHAAKSRSPPEGGRDQEQGQR